MNIKIYIKPLQRNLGITKKYIIFFAFNCLLLHIQKFLVCSNTKCGTMALACHLRLMIKLLSLFLLELLTSVTIKILHCHN